jgi:Flp pilus assembly protein TadG
MLNNASQLNHSDRGSISVLFAVAVLPMLAMTAVVADVGMVHAKRQELQTGVEAAAIAGAAKLARGSSACVGYDAVISANIDSISSLTTNCTTSSNAAHDVVTVDAEGSAAGPIRCVDYVDSFSQSWSSTLCCRPASYCALRRAPSIAGLDFIRNDIDRHLHNFCRI